MCNIRQITGLSHLFKWENLHNWWLTKYFFAPLYKAGKVGSLDNYRPIALASVVSKVLERIILDRLGVYLDTTDNQFGFKAHHSMDLCIYALKEVVELYKRQNSTVIIGFIDASNAFDRVNHQKLFSKLRLRGIPNSILRILTYWYANQSMQIKWGNCVSDSLIWSNVK